MKITVGELRVLADRLSILPDVSKFDDAEEREADRIIFGLYDIVSEAVRLSSELEKIVSISGEEEIRLFLTGAADSIRHIGYHLKDMQYFIDFNSMKEE